MNDRQDTAFLLEQFQSGDAGARAALLDVVYGELHKLAAGFMRTERPNHTLQPTAIVHEAYLRLVGGATIDWKNKAHFFAVAAQIIRRILVDHAREKAALKRGGGARRLELTEVLDDPDVAPVDLLALDEALEELGQLKERHRQVVEMRFFGGLEVKQIAQVLDVSPETVKADWQTAKAWLRRRLGSGEKT